MKVLSCEGFKMFEGEMLITPKSSLSPFKLYGVWLYKPDMNCWYCQGCSFSGEICSIVK